MTMSHNCQSLRQAISYADSFEEEEDDLDSQVDFQKSKLMPSGLKINRSKNTKITNKKRKMSERPTHRKINI